MKIKTNRWIGTIIIGIFCWVLLVGLYHAIKPLPPGLSFRSMPYRGQKVEFLADLTYLENGTLRSEQRIYGEIFAAIRSSRKYILLDMFLYNGYRGAGTTTFRTLASELTACLIEQKRKYPKIGIVVITDPINTLYGSVASPELEALKAAGVTVVETKLTSLRDSNPLWSGIWRTVFQWFGTGPGVLPHPFAAGGTRVSLRTYLALLNFKANHRKVFAADNGGAPLSIITSANPHDASSLHSNVALKITGSFVEAIFHSEQAVAALSGSHLASPAYPVPTDCPGDTTVQLLTERRIREALLALVDGLAAGDSVDMGMFYLSDRSVVRSLLAAAAKGIAVRLVLDPNRDAFGYKKNGIPNRPVAAELVRRSKGAIGIRWYDTHGEQFHTKMVLIRRADDTVSLLLGSANLTRRNLANLNLETDVLLEGKREVNVFRDADAYFERLWTNPLLTVPYEQYADASPVKFLLTYLQEQTGLSSF